MQSAARGAADVRSSLWLASVEVTQAACSVPDGAGTSAVYCASPLVCGAASREGKCSEIQA